MARSARVVVPGLPTMSPNAAIGASPCFLRLATIASIAGWSQRRRAVWAYCLMPNHVHLPIMPTWRDAERRGRVAGEVCLSAPALHRGDQRSVPVNGPSNQRNETDTFWPDHWVDLIPEGCPCCPLRAPKERSAGRAHRHRRMQRRQRLTSGTPSPRAAASRALSRVASGKPLLCASSR